MDTESSTQKQQFEKMHNEFNFIHVMSKVNFIWFLKRNLINSNTFLYFCVITHCFKHL